MARRRRRRRDEEEPSYWLSYSDMMAGLLLMFVIIISFTMLQSKRQFERDEKALREQQQILVEQQTTLDEQKATMSEQQTTLEDQQKTLESQATKMSEQQLTLEEQQKLLDEQKKEVETAKKTVETAQTELAAKQTELEKAEKELAENQKALAEAQKQLAAQQTTLEEQQTTLEEQQTQLAEKEKTAKSQEEKLKEQQTQIETQQKQMEELIGVRAELVQEMRNAFEGKANVSVDPKTGSIMFDANIMFEQTEYELLDDGKDFLREYLPDYFSILLSDEFLDYVSEVIIEGHCDTDGGYLYNLELSQQRALAVAGYCMQERGEVEYDEDGEVIEEYDEQILDSETIDKLSSIMSVNGRSYSDPIYNPDGTENKQASRRVEVKFRLKDEDMVEEMMNILNG